MNVRIRRGSPRTLLFELSRYLKIDSIQQEGRPLEFLQNQALDGTQLRRKGNDLVAVIFPAPLRAGDELNLRFSYEGEVLSEAGKGLLYVGERGTWYPSFGLSPAEFDLEFEFPAGWTLVATGKPVPPDPGREAASPGIPGGALDLGAADRGGRFQSRQVHARRGAVGQHPGAGIWYEWRRALFSQSALRRP